MWLGLDTASDRASVALGIPGRDPIEETISGARRHAAGLLPAIERLLERSGATLNDVSGVALSDGPGSFTGLRVGAALAKALVQARGLELWTAPSLMVRAAGVATPGALVLSVMNALRGEVYAAAYRFMPDEILTESVPSVHRPEALMPMQLRPALIVGEAPAEVITSLESWAGSRVIGPPEGAPHAARLIELVHRPGGATRVEAVQEWAPVYGRPAEAQARWEIVHGRPLPDSIGRHG